MQPFDWTPITLTLKLASVSVLVLLVFGTPLAWWLARTRSRARIVIESLVAMPLVLPPTVLGFYLLFLLGPTGPIGSPSPAKKPLTMTRPPSPTSTTPSASGT